MLDEIVVEVYGERYLGHLWADPALPTMAGHAVLRWRFSRGEHFVAEFPALPTDSRETVRARLLRVLDRIRGPGTAPPAPDAIARAKPRPP